MQISRRKLLSILGLGAAGAAGISGCSGDDPDGQSVSGTETAGGDGAAFHGAWPYPLPPDGHFNLFSGLQDRVIPGAYFDLIMAPGGMWHWGEERWLHLLCASFEFSENTFVYNLADGLTWSNGDPILAEDVEATFWCRWVMREQEWRYIENLEVTGERQVTFHLNSPANVLERDLVRANIFPAQTYGDWAERARELHDSGLTMDDPDGGKLNDDLQSWRPSADDYDVLTSGPYRFDFGSISETQMILRRNENGVLADQVTFDRLVIYRGETEEVTPLVMDQTLDYATHGFPLETQEAFVDEGYRLITPALHVGPSLMFSMDKVPMFKDVKARQAIAHAIDRERIAELSLGESAMAPEFMSGFSAAQTRDWLSEDDLAALDPYELDRDKATALLQEAGWTVTNAGWSTPDGKPAEFVLMYPEELLDWNTAVHELARQLTGFGFHIELEPIEGVDRLQRVLTGDFELTFENWGIGNPHPAFSFQVDYIDHNIPVAANQLGRGMAFELIQNTEAYGMVDIEELLAEAGEGLDTEAQREKVTQLAMIFNELLPKVPIFERFGNNPCLDGVRVVGWPDDDDPIYQNALYGDNFAIMLIYEGTLRPAPET